MVNLTELLYKIRHKEVLDESFVRNALLCFYREAYDDPLFEENFNNAAFELMNSVVNFQIGIIPYNPFSVRADRVIYNWTNPREAKFEIVDELDPEKNTRGVYHEGAHLLLAFYYAIDSDIFLRRTRHPVIKGAHILTQEFIEESCREDKKVKRRLANIDNYLKFYQVVLNEKGAENLEDYYMIR